MPRQSAEPWMCCDCQRHYATEEEARKCEEIHEALLMLAQEAEKIAKAIDKLSPRGLTWFIFELSNQENWFEHVRVKRMFRNRNTPDDEWRQTNRRIQVLLKREG